MLVGDGAESVVAGRRQSCRRSASASSHDEAEVVGAGFVLRTAPRPRAGSAGGRGQGQVGVVVADVDPALALQGACPHRGSGSPERPSARSAGSSPRRRGRSGWRVRVGWSRDLLRARGGILGQAGRRASRPGTIRLADGCPVDHPAGRLKRPLRGSSAGREADHRDRHRGAPARPGCDSCGAGRPGRRGRRPGPSSQCSPDATSSMRPRSQVRYSRVPGVCGHAGEGVARRQLHARDVEAGDGLGQERSQQHPLAAALRDLVRREEADRPCAAHRSTPRRRPAVRRPPA